jgi:cell division protein FtsB
MSIFDAIDLSAIQDERAREGIILLLNLVEELNQTNQALQAENQRLKDEINRLKGEQGQPPIKPNVPPAPTNYSSEKERHQPKPRAARRKRETILIDREVIVEVDRASLPTDAEFKGYDEVVVQDLIVRTDNVLFRKEVFWSASEKRSYRASLPPGYQGSYGPGVRAMAIALYFGGQMSSPKIRDYFQSVGLPVSLSTLEGWLVNGQETFHAEKDAVYEAGLRSSLWQHLDDTVTRIEGQNHCCHILCNPLYTAYRTLPHKDRLSIIDVLRNGRARTFLLNPETLSYLERLGLAARHRDRLWRTLPPGTLLDEATVNQMLDEHLPELGPQQRKHVLDALAVAAYHAQTEWPVIRLLIVDDAPQFRWVTEELALCWVHEGRHYKKLMPFVPYHRMLLDDFLGDFWNFYHDLLAYREHPTPEERAHLNADFDALFSTVTGYAALDERIAKTLTKKMALLRVLDHPAIPLHNNPAELGARARVRKQLVSFGPRSPAGIRAWDTFMTLAATTTKLGLSFYAYVLDRVSQSNQIPPLADLIDQRTQVLGLATAWSPA